MNKTTYQAFRERIGSLDCVVVRPANVPGSMDPVKTSAVGVFCHGFGAGGEDLVGLASELLENADRDAKLKLVFPAAPISLEDQGMPGSRAWWLLSIQRMISALEDGKYEQVREEVPAGIDDARARLSETIQLALAQENLQANRLLLAGFSQGAMLAVETAIHGLQVPPAKMCLYSGALICENRWKPQAAKLQSSAILQSHGRLDPILPFQTGLWLRDMLQAARCQVDFIEFNGPHTIPFEAILRTANMLTELAET